MTLTLGSLFDGIGGFPLAAIRQGITPLWASEIEPFPIQVTKHHFPETLHMGDITRLDGAKLPPVSPFSVATGSSEWSVVYDFARYYGGVAPRFDREGRLVLTGWPERAERLIGDGTAVTELVYRDRRYGVLSQVLVRDRYSGQTETVSDEEFIAQGGMARRVMTMPGRSNFQTMRYTGKFQLERAKGERIRLEVEIGEAFSAWPGELVRVQRSGWDRNGLYRVAQSTVGMDSRGYWTRLELAPPDFVV